MIRSAPCSPDGRYALSASDDNTVRVRKLIWQYEFPDPAEWDDGARPYITNSLTLSPPHAGVSPKECRADDAEVRLKETLSVYLRAERPEAVLGRPESQMMHALFGIGPAESLARTIRLELVRALQGDTLTGVSHSEASFIVWDVRNVTAANETFSVVAATSPSSEKENAQSERADALVALASRPAYPLVYALRELQALRASVKESVPHEPSASMLTDCDKARLWGNSPFFRHSLYVSEMAATRYLPASLREAKLPVVFFLAESGTGKSMLAGLIHQLSHHGNGRFEEPNCAAIPATLAESELFECEQAAHDKALTAKPGIFETANGGTFFLDEIEETTKDFQSNLLKVLDTAEFRRLGSIQAKKADCYVILAASEDPVKLSQQEVLLPELWHWVKTLTITVPPLRERSDDVRLLVDKTLAQFNSKVPPAERKTVSEEVLALFKGYSWPEDVRELMQYLEVTYVSIPPQSKQIEVDHLPEGFFRDLGLPERREQGTGTDVDATETLDANVERLEREYLAASLPSAKGTLARSPGGPERRMRQSARSPRNSAAGWPKPAVLQPNGKRSGLRCSPARVGALSRKRAGNGSLAQGVPRCAG